MDSDDEDVSENDILDWYKSEVNHIWDTATDSAFADLSSNLTDMFRQVMNDVKQRNQPGGSGIANGHTSSSVTNGHVSGANGVDGHSGAGEGPSTSGTGTTQTVSVSSEQLMAILQDDEDWLEADENCDEDQEMTTPLSVQLTDESKPSNTEQDQKNVKGVSREAGFVKYRFSADSILLFLSSFMRGISRIILFVIKYSLLLIAVLLVVYVASLLHLPLQRWFLRHVQDYIYPSMRLLRLVTLPLIQYYPSLTDWHEETCLIPNPLFRQRDIDCWSCATIQSVEIRSSNLSVNEFEAKYYHTGALILLKGVGDKVSLQDIKQLHKTYGRLFLQGIGRFSSSQRFHNISHFLEQDEHLFLSQGQVSWKVNRVGTGRLFRQLFHRPPFIPLHTEVALHKHLFMDGSQAPPYKLPVLEFANVWIAQGSGSRRVLFEPTASCSAICPTLETTLHPGDLMFYNWQFWDPQSKPNNGKSGISVTYVGSFY